jgi:hypothetical protein
MKNVSTTDIYIEPDDFCSQLTLENYIRHSFSFSLMYYRFDVASKNTEVSTYYSHIYRGGNGF